MHKIPPQVAQEEIEHSKIALRHGKSVEEIGYRLQNIDPTEKEHGQLLVEYGKTIQNYAQECLDKAQKLAKSSSIELFTEVLQAHIYATQSYIESVTEFQKGLQEHLHQQKNYLSQGSGVAESRDDNNR